MSRAQGSLTNGTYLVIACLNGQDSLPKVEATTNGKFTLTAANVIDTSVGEIQVHLISNPPAFSHSYPLVEF